jgi:hypothetical protein
MMAKSEKQTAVAVEAALRKEERIRGAGAPSRSGAFGNKIILFSKKKSPFHDFNPSKPFSL